MGALSGAIMGFIGVVIWATVSVAAFSAFIGAPLIFAIAIPAVIGGAAILMVAASPNDSASFFAQAA